MDRSVAIRVDGNGQIGLGHVYRGLSLAFYLKDSFDITFFMRESSLTTPIEGAGFSVSKIPSLSVEEELDWILNQLHGNAIVVLDGYEFDAQYQSAIHSAGYRTVLVDDLVREDYNVDVIINPSPGTDYNLQSDIQVFEGLDYSFLRQEFLEVAKSNRTDKERNAVLLCMGGTDPDCLIPKFLDQLGIILPGELVHVIGGNQEENERWRESHPAASVKFHTSLSAREIIELGDQCRCCLVPTSTILIEMFAIKVPAIAGYFVDNQEKFYQYCQTNESVIAVGNLHEVETTDLETAFQKLQTFHSKKLVDGLQAQRILDIFNAL